MDVRPRFKRERWGRSYVYTARFSNGSLASYKRVKGSGISTAQARALLDENGGFSDRIKKRYSQRNDFLQVTSTRFPGKRKFIQAVAATIIGNNTIAASSPKFGLATTRNVRMLRQEALFNLKRRVGSIMDNIDSDTNEAYAAGSKIIRGKKVRYNYTYYTKWRTKSSNASLRRQTRKSQRRQ